jgi:GntR family transcriptional regulator/MocR family aminotransferase
LRIDGRSKRPLHEQIYAGLRARILDGELAPGVRLPSSRQLAAELGVARSTVLQAIDALDAEGFIVARAASSTRVAPEIPGQLERGGPRGAVRSRARPRLSACARALGAIPHGAPRLGAAPRAFRPGIPALDLFPSALWAKMAARSYGRASAGLLDGGDPAGYRPLREAICAHVSAARGVRCGAEQIFVTAGAQRAVVEIARLIVDAGDEAWIEDPAYLGARSALLSTSARIVPVPVDDQGLDVAAGIARAPAARLIIAGPSHHYPLGVTLSLARRLELLRHAARSGAVIIEDDYDSELRHHGRPVMAMQGLDDAGSVVYVGTFSKTLFPGCGLGFLVAPPALVDAFAAARAAAPAVAPILDQVTLARFISEGHFATHVRRMRAAYRERSEALHAALAAELAGALLPRRSETGMQCAATLRVRCSDLRVREAAAARGVEVSPLSEYYMGAKRRAGLLLGFGGVRPSAIRAGVEKLARAIEDCLKKPYNPG